MQEELQPELAVRGWNETPNTFSPLDERCGCRQAHDTLSHLPGHLLHPSSPRPPLEQCGTRRPPPDTPGWAPAAPGAPVAQQRREALGERCVPNPGEPPASSLVLGPAARPGLCGAARAGSQHRAARSQPCSSGAQRLSVAGSGFYPLLTRAQ